MPRTRAIAGEGLQGAAGVQRAGAGADDGRGGPQGGPRQRHRVPLPEHAGQPGLCRQGRQQPAVPLVAEGARPGLPRDRAFGPAHAGAADPAQPGGRGQRGGVDCRAGRQQRDLRRAGACGPNAAGCRCAHRQPGAGVFQRGGAGDSGLAAARHADQGAGRPAAHAADADHADVDGRAAGTAGPCAPRRLRAVEPGNGGRAVRAGGAGAGHRRPAGGGPERGGAGAPRQCAAV
eukprot:XP_015584125.1 spidroin-2-like [Ricinus communis]